MFERDDVTAYTARVWLDQREAALLDQHGAQKFQLHAGNNEITWEKGIEICQWMQQYTDQITYKSGQNRWRAILGGIANAFGPEFPRP